MNSKTKSSLTVLNNPQAVVSLLKTDGSIDSQTTQVSSVNTSSLSNDADDFLVLLTDSLSETNSTFEQALLAVQKKEELVTRDITTVIDYTAKAYELITEHWGEIYFCLDYLKRKGKLDKLRNHPKFKAFFDTLFEEEED